LAMRLRWIVVCVGFLLPSLWLAGTALLYALLPEFRGSGTAFGLALFLAVVLTVGATLTWRAGWRRRLLYLASVETLLLAQIAILLGWAYLSFGFGTRQQKIEVTAEWMRPLESRWAIQSPGKDHSVRTVSDVRRGTEDSLRFELRAGEMYCDLFGKRSFRSEVNTREFVPMGSERWYSFSLLLPPDFPMEKNRLVLAQWHGADKKYLAEPSRSPSLAFRYSGGRFFITIRHSEERIVRDPQVVSSQKLFETPEFPLGVWHDFVVQAKWSYQADGFVNVWWNDHQIVYYHGPVGYNDDLGPYFKFGLYRDDSARTYVAYFNHVKSGVRRADVDF